MNCVSIAYCLQPDYESLRLERIANLCELCTVWLYHNVVFINTQFRVSIKKRFLVATTIMLVIFAITTAFVKIPTKTCKL